MNKSKKDMSGDQHSESFKRKVRYYMKLDWGYTFCPDYGVGGFFAEIQELPGCYTQGETLEETYENLRNALQFHIEWYLENGHKIPTPYYSKKAWNKRTEERHKRMGWKKKSK
jgi:predicted RNase H-like HicB family nuclease